MSVRVGSAALALLVLALPFASFLLLALVRPLRRSAVAAATVSITAMVAAVGSAFWLSWRSLPRALLQSPSTTWAWIPADGGPMATVGVMVDDKSMAMCMLVTFVSLMVQLYSWAYLHDEPRPSLGRYYAYHSLFAFSMLGLVLSPSFIQMFVFWELVGLCSYLLIGYWYDRPPAARAAVKAFWITKLGDLGFVAGIVMLWAAAGTFDFWELFRMANVGALPREGLALIMFLIYLGAVGKSAQFPLHIWLPDAMEGPTPVSALIHAATMVTAGVFLVTRAFPLFLLVPDVLTLIAWVGAFTALLAASMACVESDIKRVLAYSTVSQLGYMMAAAGAQAPGAGFNHLLTHGIFKALLFLGAGVVIHVFHTNDVFRMGGLRGQPLLWAPFVLATLALAGVPPLPGFFTKEAILGGVLEAHLTVPFVMLAVTAFLTAFYMFRVVFLAFFRGGLGDGHAHPHVPGLMSLVCWALTVLTIATGVAMARQVLTAGHHDGAPAWLPAFSLGLAGSGILLAWLTYQRQALDPARLSAALAPLDWAARRRYGIDAVFVGFYRFVLLAFSRLVGWLDRYIVDGVLNVVSACTLRAGDRLRRIQSGLAQDYLYGVALGVLVLFVLAQWRLR
ncbi:MAG TPA: NADH-quinone oxidoreductase subunit L [Candidatus Binatia bacterium]|nr:NADH-quinone oxidoreductase subunit L [Candidatus Binatia bacterium]